MQGSSFSSGMLENLAGGAVGGRRPNECDIIWWQMCCSC